MCAETGYVAAGDKYRERPTIDLTVVSEVVRQTLFTLESLAHFSDVA